MLARYLKDDPQAIQMFGDDLANVPSMSAAQAKGVIGGASMYLTQKHLNAAEQAQRAQTTIAEKQLAIQQADAAAKEADRLRQATFNREITQRLNPPLFFKSAGEAPTTFDADFINQAAARAGLFGQPEHINLLNAATNYAQRTRGLPLGQEITTPSGTRITGLGAGISPHLEPAKIGGLPLGQELTTPGGTRLTGLGPGFQPHVDATTGLPMGTEITTPAGTTITGLGPGQKPDVRAAAKPSTADETFMNVVPAYAQQLQDFESTVKRFGNWELADPEGRAKLKQLPYQMAISYAKIADPSSVAREGEVQAAQKYLLPSGLMTWNTTTEAAIAAQKEDLVNRVKTWSANNQGKLPANMPLWLRQRLATGTTGEFTSADEVRKAYQEGKLKWDEAAQILSQKKFSN